LSRAYAFEITKCHAICASVHRSEDFLFLLKRMRMSYVYYNYDIFFKSVDRKGSISTMFKETGEINSHRL